MKNLCVARCKNEEITNKEQKKARGFPPRLFMKVPTISAKIVWLNTRSGYQPNYKTTKARQPFSNNQVFGSNNSRHAVTTAVK